MRNGYDAVLVGGGGFLGSRTAETLLNAGATVLTVDRREPAPSDHPCHDWLRRDLLTDPTGLPSGAVVVFLGGSDIRRRHPWTLVQDTALATARIVPALCGRKVTLVSSVEVYGAAVGPLTEDSRPSLPLTDADIERWCDTALQSGPDDCGRDRAVAMCLDLLGADSTGRWGYALAKRAQELLLGRVQGSDRLTVLRVSNVFGLGQHRMLTRLVARARAGLPLEVTNTVRSFASVDEVAQVITEAVNGALPPGTRNVGTRQLELGKLADLVLEQLDVAVPVRLHKVAPSDHCGLITSTFPPCRWATEHELVDELRQFIRTLDEATVFALRSPVQVVIPPRPFRPDVVAERQARALWSGNVAAGNTWTTRLTEQLHTHLRLSAEQELILTSSGSAALRLAILAVVGPAQPGAVAVLPSYTFAATAEVLVQLGYQLRFCDVDPLTWTMCPSSLREALAAGDVDVAVSVDTLGNPCDYDTLRVLCEQAGAALVADSAPSLGASYRGRPVGTQARAHAFSMSFAKVISAGGAGGAVVLDQGQLASLSDGPNWLRSSRMPELPAISALDLVERLPDLTAARAEVAAAYDEFLGRRGDVQLQQVLPEATHAHVHWVLRIAGTLSTGASRRDAVRTRLASLGVGTKPYYSPLQHARAWPGSLAFQPELPVSTTIESEALALPMSSELSIEDTEQICVIVDRVLDELPATTHPI